MLYQCIALAVLSPAIVAAAAIWHYHSVVRRVATLAEQEKVRGALGLPDRTER
jgi:hypothetical protein